MKTQILFKALLFSALTTIINTNLSAQALDTSSVETILQQLSNRNHELFKRIERLENEKKPPQSKPQKLNSQEINTSNEEILLINNELKKLEEKIEILQNQTPIAAKPFSLDKDSIDYRMLIGISLILMLIAILYFEIRLSAIKNNMTKKQSDFWNKFQEHIAKN